MRSMSLKRRVAVTVGAALAAMLGTGAAAVAWPGGGPPPGGPVGPLGPIGGGENCFHVDRNEFCTVEPNPGALDAIAELLQSIPLPPPPT
jgi:hypothetical protein